MKLNKGFTLIELLAVIVILAIIALIATPTILGVIETARQGAAESSALGYIDAVEKHIAISEVDGTIATLPNGTYGVADLQTAGVNIKGEYPSTTAGEGYITIDNGEVTKAVLLINTQYYVTYNRSAGNMTTVDKTKPTMVTTDVTCTATACTSTTQVPNNNTNNEPTDELEDGTTNNGTETGPDGETQIPDENPVT